MWGVCLHYIPFHYTTLHYTALNSATMTIAVAAFIIPDQSDAIFTLVLQICATCWQNSRIGSAVVMP